MATQWKPEMTASELLLWVQGLLEATPTPLPMLPTPCRLWYEDEKGVVRWFVGGAPSNTHKGLDPYWSKDIDQAQIVRYQATYDWAMALGVGAKSSPVG